MDWDSLQALATQEAATHWARHLLWAMLITPALTVLGILLFGRGYKKRIADLEARPAITQVFNFDPKALDPERELQEASRRRTEKGLREVIATLDQHPLGNGNTYAKLPNGTNIVTFADGTIKLATPVEISDSFTGFGEATFRPAQTARLTRTKGPPAAVDDERPK